MRAIKTIALSSLLLVSGTLFADGGNSGASTAKQASVQNVKVSYLHFEKNGEVMMSFIPQNLTDFEVIVLDENGKSVYKKEFSSQYGVNLVLSDLLEQGVYTVVVSHESKEYQRSKVIL